MMSSHTTVEKGGGGETVTCESRSMKTTEQATARWSNQAPRKGPNPNKPRRYKKKGKTEKVSQNCCIGTTRIGPMGKEEKPKSPKNKEEEGRGAQRNAPPMMLSGLRSSCQDATALEALEPFEKGSQPPNRRKEKPSKDIRKTERMGKGGYKEENADFPLIPPSGTGPRSCATFLRDNTPRDKESRDLERSTRKTKPRRKEKRPKLRKEKIPYDMAGIQLDNKPASFILNLASGDVEHQYYDIKRLTKRARPASMETRAGIMA